VRTAQHAQRDGRSLTHVRRVRSPPEDLAASQVADGYHMLPMLNAFFVLSGRQMDPPQRPCLERVPKENEVTQTIEEKNKAFVLEAFETLFNKKGLRRCGAFLVPELHPAQRAHSAGTRGPLRVGQGHTGSLHYENGLTAPTETTCCSTAGSPGMGLPANWIVVDIVRLGERPTCRATGTSSRTKRQRKRPLAACPCSGRHFPRDDWVRRSSRRLHQRRQCVRAMAKPFGSMVRRTRRR